MRRNKLLVFLALGALVPLFTASAQYANEWINFNQSYYKIPVAQEGVYELDFSTLTTAGISLNTIDARTFRLYHRGQEVAINVIGQNDGRIDAGDAIQFLGKPNNGESDTPLYSSPELQPHTFYNLFSDTTAYFLTWSLDGTFGKRMQVVNTINNTTSLPARASYLKNVRNVLVNNGIVGRAYAPGNQIYRSAFDLGEAWTGTRFAGDRDFTISAINKQVRTEENLLLELLIQGRNNQDHEVEVLVGPDLASLRSVANLSFQDFAFSTVSAPLNWSDINVSGELVVRIRTTTSSIDRVSLSYLQLSYNKSFDMAGESRLANYFSRCRAKFSICFLY